MNESKTVPNGIATYESNNYNSYMTSAPPMMTENQTVPNVLMEEPQAVTPAAIYESNNYNSYMASAPPMMTANRTVPNLLMEEPQTVPPAAMIQEGVSNANGMKRQETIVYAVDHDIPKFDILDPIQRRTFFRKVFNVLLLQHFLMLPIIEIFILSFDEPVHPAFYGAVSTTTLFVDLIFYFCSNARRYRPLNMCALAAVTVLMGMHEGLYATRFGHTGMVPHLVTIIQMLMVTAYSKQTRFRFTNINAFFLVLIVFIACNVFMAPVMTIGALPLTVGAAFHVMYAIYDMQLMLSGHHGYNLQPEEHIFAAVNIYADFVNLLWRLLRWLILDHFIRLYRFFRSCCFAEVC